jgi:hypothetical protein
MKERLIILCLFFSFVGNNVSAQDRIKIAVMDFKPGVGVTESTVDGISEMLISSLFDTRKFSIIERIQIDKAIQEQGFQKSSISAGQITQIGKILGVNYVLVGIINFIVTERTFEDVVTSMASGEYNIDVRIVNVESGEVVSTAGTGVKGTETLRSVMPKLAQELAGKIESEQAANPPKKVYEGPPTGIAIDISTKTGGTLFFQNEEIVTLWDNDTHSIPIEKPGTYTVKMVYHNGPWETRSITITTRGVIKVEFTYIYREYKIGETGLAGGIVFYDKGNYSDGWRYLEAAPASTEFSNISWGRQNTFVRNTIRELGAGKRNTQIITEQYNIKGMYDLPPQLCANLNIGGYNDWFLPSREELNLIYRNLKIKDIGGFNTNAYWSSTIDGAVDGGGYVWYQFFNNGEQYNNWNPPQSGARYSNNVRAIRAF